jgi:hypothetical protein
MWTCDFLRVLPAPILGRKVTGRHTTVLGGMRWCVMVPLNDSGPLSAYAQDPIWSLEHHHL